MSDRKQWLAVYTKPRWEKKVHELFIKSGVESYCPLTKNRRQWSDRVKLVEEPLFKSYVFVHIHRADQSRVRLTGGVINFVYWLGRPAVMKQSEIDRIKKFLNEYENVRAEAIDLQPDDAVVVTAGALMEKEGRVLKRFGNTVTIEIASLGYRLVARVDRRNVARKL